MERDNIILRHEKKGALVEIKRKLTAQKNLSINLTINEKVNERFSSKLFDTGFSAKTYQLAL